MGVNDEQTEVETSGSWLSLSLFLSLNEGWEDGTLSECPIVQSRAAAVFPSEDGTLSRMPDRAEPGGSSFSLVAIDQHLSQHRGEGQG